jgi:hypothetical protein
MEGVYREQYSKTNLKRIMKVEDQFMRGCDGRCLQRALQQNKSQTNYESGRPIHTGV